MTYPITGGSTPYRLLSTASQNPAVVKASPGTLDFIAAVNTAGATYYLKLYDKATAPVAADTPVATIPVPVGAVVAPFPQGLAFSTGIALRLTAGIADADVANAAAGVAINGGFR